MYKRLNKWFISALGLLTILAWGGRVEAAQSVIFNYRFFRESISVSELSTFAETGELSSSLKTYLRMANTEPDQLQRALTREIEVDPILLSKVLNSLPGEVLLDQVSDVIRTPTGSASRQSLRAALLNSALPDGLITLMEVFENYPTTDVHIEGDRLVEIYSRLDRVLGTLNDLENDLGIN